MCSSDLFPSHDISAGLEAVLNEFKNTYKNEAIEPVMREMRAMLEIEKDGL